MRKEIRKSMLDADLNARYWKYLSQRYENLEQYVKVFQALMASGAVAGWAFWDSVTIIWKTLSGISAVLSIALATLKIPDKIKQMSELHGKWSELMIQYEDLLRKFDDQNRPEEVQKTFEDYRKIQVSLASKESLLPDDKKLLKKCFEEVLRARGLKRR
jgi:hypothetical protein